MDDPDEDAWLDIPGQDPLHLGDWHLKIARYWRETVLAERWVYWWRMEIAEGRPYWHNLAVRRLSLAAERLDALRRKGR